MSGSREAMEKMYFTGTYILLGEEDNIQIQQSGHRHQMGLMPLHLSLSGSRAWANSPMCFQTVQAMSTADSCAEAGCWNLYRVDCAQNILIYPQLHSSPFFVVYFHLWKHSRLETPTSPWPHCYRYSNFLYMERERRKNDILRPDMTAQSGLMWLYKSSIR